jgi:hypothetical protein
MTTDTSSTHDRHADSDAYRQRLAAELAVDLSNPDTGW